MNTLPKHPATHDLTVQLYCMDGANRAAQRDNNDLRDILTNLLLCGNDSTVSIAAVGRFQAKRFKN